MSEKVRAHVIISGRVQGVFFRAETRKAAQQYGVFGWVKNKPDGTVEALFEGDADQVNAILKWCWKGSPNARVDHVDVKKEAYSGEFQDFKVAYD